MNLKRSDIDRAMNLSGYDEWQPHFDVPDLNRPRSRPENLPGQGRIAAVLLMIYDADATRGEPRLVLTRRHLGLSKHPGQISFPGGRQDPGENLEETALRETEEEVGIAPYKIELLGQLNPVYIPPSDFTVTPFVAWHRGTPRFRPQQDEVAEIIEAPLELLLNPGTLVRGPIATSNQAHPDRPKKIIAPYYAVGGHQVWGATAIILDELIDRIRVVIADSPGRREVG